MKVKNIAFSGFMASILMAGAAYAEGAPTLATDQYVIQGVNYAISQAQDYTDGVIGIGALPDGETVMGYVNDAVDDAIVELNKKQKEITEDDKLNADLVDDSTSENKFVSASEKLTWNAKQDALPATTGMSGKVLKVGTSGLEWADDANSTYDDAALAGRVSANETAINTINTSDVMQSGATADKISAIASNTAAIASNASAIADLDTGKQNALSDAQLAAVNSGIDATKVGKYDAYNTTLTGLAADITELDSKKQDALPTTTGNTGKVLKVGASGLEWADDANSQYDDTALAGRVGSLETTVAGHTTDIGSLQDAADALSDDIAGLNSDINAVNTGLKARMTAAETSITNLNTNKANATDVYTKTEVNGLLDNKQASLTEAQLAATNSGITAGKVSGYDSHVGNTDIHVTATEKSTWNAKQDAISDLSTIRTNATAGKNAADTIATYGNIVTHNVAEFATAAQGAKADSALQNSCEEGYCLVTPTGDMVSIETVSENINWVIPTSPVTE